MTPPDDDKPQADRRRPWHLAGVVVILALMGVFMLRSLEDRSWDARRNEFAAHNDIELAVPADADAVAEPGEVRCVAGSHPETGEIFTQAAVGANVLTFTGGSEDALVKLRHEGRTALAFYVRAGETAQVANVADGSYDLLYATGADFSQACLEFTTGMRVLRDPRALVLAGEQGTAGGGADPTRAPVEYSLGQPAEGGVPPIEIDPVDFRD